MGKIVEKYTKNGNLFIIKSENMKSEKQIDRNSWFFSKNVFYLKTNSSKITYYRKLNKSLNK